MPKINPDLPCLTCRWSAFAMTKHAPPRIDVNRPGKCTYPVALIKAPAVAQCNVRGFNVYYVSIWPGMNWKECATYEKKP